MLVLSYVVRGRSPSLASALDWLFDVLVFSVGTAMVINARKR
jgi:hypothetical protein